MSFEVRKISCGYNDKVLLKSIEFKVEKGEILCILGPNGVGKTTLLKSMLGFLKIKSGEIIFNDIDIQKISNKQRASIVAYVPQAHEPPFPYRVLDVVVMGGYSHLGYLKSPSRNDYKEAEDILESLNIKYLKDYIYTEISGGERQLILIARALAQKPKILIMDEPTSNLDYGNVIKVLRQINILAAKGMSIIMTSHSPEQAFLCSAKILLIEKNNKVHIGSAEEILTEENMKSAYGEIIKIKEFEIAEGKKVKTCIPILKEAVFYE